ncbi:M14 metallopeptidase family protein [Flavobacterium sp. K5-23]|uniref:M14 family metallopeptidase n=1 Tax=Flavobacterium sp. K5-23 TaxID=2746225 RepID=UPI002010351E|nr:M14 metallopeptidase family protein [Flavobacterium sp. K5-23]UQD57059.1 peptidase M14 [Flavobacterium sp. K5-23]
MNFEQLFAENKEQSISGRYLTLESISTFLKRINTDNQLHVVGQSVLGKPIYKYLIGEGKTRIFLWSQMHGNESTTTKALLDFFNVLHNGSDLAKELLSNFTFCALPMLNPDGSNAYTRVNANDVDLNRDSQELSQPESIVLWEVFDDFKPHYCYNLHDQRTIFGVGDTSKPATMSFLAPSYNKKCEINESRLKAINLIAGINDILQQFIPNQIGRFDDSFNINCVGDAFQAIGVPTLLFEAGHYPDDYQREVTRKFVFFALVSSFIILSENDIVGNRMDDYLKIPQNSVVFYDFLYKNVKINYDGIEKITNFAAQYKEELIDDKICFNAYVSEIGDLEGKSGHYEYDANGVLYTDENDNIPEVGQKADFYLTKNIKFVNGLVKM